MKRKLSIWQITFPLSIVLIFGLGSLTAIFLVQGRYLFDFEATPKQLRIRTDVDKRETLLLEGSTQLSVEEPDLEPSLDGN
jgi:hypothetical protein